MRDLSAILALCAIFALAACSGGDNSGIASAEADNSDTAEWPKILEDSISTEYQPLYLEQLAGGLKNPWALAFLPDGRWLVTERPGDLNIIDKNGEITRVSGLPGDIVTRNQGGLMDVVPHPDHDDNGWLYFTYSRGDRGATATTLFRARLDGDSLVDREELFTQDRRSDPGRHYGSRLAFLPDGTLLMSIGDRGSTPPRAQDKGDHAGTLLRLNDDGSVPDDNPFVGDDDVLPEIFSYGHRNIQGLIVHPETSDIWATEHGPRGSDELNRVEAGKNYGWPAVTLGRDYATQEPFGDSVRSKEGMEDPLVDFTPSLAASGLAYIDSEKYRSQWAGNLLAGGLRAQQVRRLVLENGEVVHQEELLRGKIGRIRDVRVGSDDLIYILTDESNGGLYRLGPAD